MIYHMSTVRVGRRGRENLIQCGYTNRKNAARSRLIQHSTVSCMEIDGSRAMAVSANSENDSHKPGKGSFWRPNSATSE